MNPKLSTADCTKFLTTDPKIAELVRDRLGLSDDPTLADAGPEERTYVTKAMQDSVNPKKWVRQQKYKLGSTTDKEHMDFGSAWPQYVPDGILRLFWLRDTDHISVILIEHNGAIVAWEDASD